VTGGFAVLTSPRSVGIAGGTAVGIGAITGIAVLTGDFGIATIATVAIAGLAGMAAIAGLVSITLVVISGSVGEDPAAVLDRVAQRLGTAGRSTASGLLRGAARPLPGAAQARYLEEWRGELYDLRGEGARWWRRAGYVAQVLLFTAPVLAVTLRLSARKAVD
jgi:hypothetical protein